MRRTPALDAARQVEVTLKSRDAVKEVLAPRADNEDSDPVLDLPSPYEIGRQDPKTRALLMVDVGRRLDGHDRHRRLLVPARIEPVAEVRPVRNRQLQKTKRRYGRRIHPQVVVTCLRHAETDKTEDRIRIRRRHLDLGLVGRRFETDHETTVLLPDAIRRIRRPLVGMDELDLVVVGAFLRDGKERYALAFRQQFLARRLQHEGRRTGIIPDCQPEPAVLNRHIREDGRRQADG